MNALQRKLITFWRERNPRERRFLAVCAGVLLVALYYVALWAPASEGRAKLGRQLPQLEAQLAEMQRQIAQLKTAGGNARSNPTDLRGGVQEALDQVGLSAELRPQSANTLQLVIPQAPFDRLLALFDALQGAGHITRLEVQAADNGLVSATLELQR